MKIMKGDLYINPKNKTQEEIVEITNEWNNPYVGDMVEYRHVKSNFPCRCPKENFLESYVPYKSKEQKITQEKTLHLVSTDQEKVTFDLDDGKEITRINISLKDMLSLVQSINYNCVRVINNNW